MYVRQEYKNIFKRRQSEKEFFDKKVTRKKNEYDKGPHTEKGHIWLDILGLQSDLGGKDVLECACGTGTFTTVLAERAKSVRSFDISSESVRITKMRMEKTGEKNVQIEIAAMEELPYQDESFDVVVGLFILHHLADLEQGIKQIFRVLRPGGKAVFYETCSNNPILMFWRKYLTGRFGIPKLGTQDEHPLTGSNLRTISSAFKGVTKVSYPRFRFFGKLYFQLFRNFKTAKFLLEGLDNCIYRYFPFVQQYSYQVRITLMK